MKEVTLIRTSKSAKTVYGVLLVMDGNIVDSVFKTIENREKLFPVGKYPLVFEFSPKFNVNLWELKDVVGRSEIKIHQANYYQQLEGCVAIGKVHADINEDSEIDIQYSKAALSEFHLSLIKQKTSTITVIEI